MTELDEAARRNRELWTQANADYTGEAAARSWSQEEITWGVFAVAERDVRVLPDVRGLDVVELGCGTAYVSAWLARRGARPVGIDVTPAQLETARALQREHALEFPLLEANAEQVPLADASFDLAVSEYGASLWCDPYRWIPEAARLLRPGGRLVFLRTSTLVVLCSRDDGPAQEQLVRPQFGMYRFEWPQGGVEYHLAHGEWIRVLRDSGFEVEALLELQAPEGARTHARYDFVTAEWARRWPAEEIWRARKA